MAERRLHRERSFWDNLKPWRDIDKAREIRREFDELIFHTSDAKTRLILLDRLVDSGLTEGLTVGVWRSLLRGIAFTTVVGPPILLSLDKYLTAQNGGYPVVGNAGNAIMVSAVFGYLLGIADAGVSSARTYHTLRPVFRAYDKLHRELYPERYQKHKPQECAL
ncbi:MAG: hypothetical protein V1659_02575 [Candidatus Woesearchaeota archaeon]